MKEKDVMTIPEESFLQSLLDKFPQPTLKAVIENAPQEVVQRINALPKGESKPLSAFFIFPQELLSRLHPSWFDEIASFCPSPLRKIALKAMREEMGVEKKTFSDAVRRFLLQEVLSQWPEKGMAVDPQPELPLLKTCAELEIFSLAELVPLYDIVEDVRKVVDKKKLQKLFERLSPMQQKYLQEILQGRKFKVYFPLPLKDFLCMNVKEAKKFLHERGLERIGNILQGENPQTVWSVLHRMDKRDALLIHKGKDMKDLPCELKLLQKKFLHAFHFIQRWQG